MSELLIRPARESDMAQVQVIYAHHVRTSSASFEIEPPDVPEMIRRLHDVQARRLPFLVAETNGRIAGYAYANLYRTREAYRFTCEDSVYVSPDFHKRGAGFALLDEAIRQSAANGFKQMVAVIGGSDNQGSIRLHEKLGFVRVGLLPKVGFKFDRWHDSVLMQREL
jgi:phosphinothricin acetyltransferase